MCWDDQKVGQRYQYYNWSGSCDLEYTGATENINFFLKIGWLVFDAVFPGFDKEASAKITRLAEVWQTTENHLALCHDFLIYQSSQNYRRTNALFGCCTPD